MNVSVVVEVDCFQEKYDFFNIRRHVLTEASVIFSSVAITVTFELTLYTCIIT